MKPNLDTYIEKLKSVFRTNDYRIAHAKSKYILLEMAKDNSVLFEIIKRNLSSPGFFSKKRINPVIAFDIEKNKDFSITAHCWMPLPDRATNISHQSIHHHGRLLLTSVSPLGEGYESIIFKKEFKMDKDKGVAEMKIEKKYKNPKYNIEFVDSFTPHVVFYPNDFSITYAMWSYDKKDGVLATLRQSKFIQNNKKAILKILRKLGALKRVGVNVLEYFDFYPDGKKIQAMQDRVMYPVGSNENFIHNLFYILQKIGFDDKEFVRKLKTSLTKEEVAVAEKPMDKFLNDVPIEDTFDPIHLNVPKINFSKQQLLSSVS
jgi:hypothetical protein